jgi:hypothetical protein
MIKNLIIIIVILLIYGGVGWVMSIGWPKTCKPGQTTSYNEPVKIDDAVFRVCDGKWTHDYGNNKKWTQNVIDICTSGGEGGKNCWDEDGKNNITVKEINENSNGCQQYVGNEKEQKFNCKELMDAIIKNDSSKLGEYKLEPTREQQDDVNSKCQDCKLSLHIDTTANQNGYDVKRTDECLLNNNSSNLATCWGPCHGECGTGKDGVHGRKWKKEEKPGTGGQPCPTYTPDGLKSEDVTEFIQTEVCINPGCPGCCQTNSNKANKTCNDWSGGSEGQSECSNQVYSWDGGSGSKDSKNVCRWSLIGPDTGKIFGDAQSTCNFLDVTWKDQGNVVEGNVSIDQQLVDLNCKWTPSSGPRAGGICLPKLKEIDNDESLTEYSPDKTLVNFVPNSAFYNDMNSQVNPLFEGDQQLSNLLSVSRTGWAIVDSDDTECGKHSATECGADSMNCKWHALPDMGTCKTVREPGEEWSEQHRGEMDRMCQKQHVINSLIQQEYSKQSGQCVFEEKGIRISLTGIPHSIDADAPDANVSWLWNHFDVDGTKTQEAANYLKENGRSYDSASPLKKIIFTDSTLNNQVTPIVQKHPVIDGSKGLGHVMTNHYFVYLPIFKVTGLGNMTNTNKVAELQKIKAFLRSSSFKDSNGYKIVVSNIDNMTGIDGSGNIIYTYTDTEKSLVEFTDDRVMMDEKKCMIDHSRFEWSEHPDDGDHPVINGARWRPNQNIIEKNTADNNQWNCSERLLNDTDGVISYVSHLKWNEKEDTEINETKDKTSVKVLVPKFSGFLRGSKFSNVQPQGDDTLEKGVWNSHATKRIKKVAGVRCKIDDEKASSKCLSKNKIYTDFSGGIPCGKGHEDDSDCLPCSSIQSSTACNNKVTVNPKCTWNAFDVQMTAEEAKDECDKNRTIVK